MPLIFASPAYRSGTMLVAVTFDEANASDGTSCCNETPGPNNPTPGFSAILAPIYKQFGIPIPAVQTGGGQTGAVLFNPRYIAPGSVDTTGSYNHYSALRSYEDILGLTTGGGRWHRAHRLCRTIRRGPLRARCVQCHQPCIRAPRVTRADRPARRCPRPGSLGSRRRPRPYVDRRLPVNATGS